MCCYRLKVLKCRVSRALFIAQKLRLRYIIAMSESNDATVSAQ